MYEYNNGVDYVNYADAYGYVSVHNMGGFKAVIKLRYTENGEEKNLIKDNILLFNSEQLMIPATATDVFVVIYIVDGLGALVPVYNNALSKSGIINVDLYGTVWAVDVNVIGETEPSQNWITITNKGAFVARYTLQYYFDEKKYTLEIPTFSVGMKRQINLPDAAKDINLKIQVDVNGLGSWFIAYDQCFATLNALEAVLTGVSWSPTVTVDNDTLVAVLEECKEENNLVGGVGAEPPLPITVPTTLPATLPHSGTNASEVINKYMNFMGQAHQQFIELLDKTMGK
ncbi:MAG: hypothetical protein ACRC7R_07030 [Sarcina sp.]